MSLNVTITAHNNALKQHITWTNDHEYLDYYKAQNTRIQWPWKYGLLENPKCPEKGFLFFFQGQQFLFHKSKDEFEFVTVHHLKIIYHFLLNEMIF